MKSLAFILACLALIFGIIAVVRPKERIAPNPNPIRFGHMTSDTNYPVIVVGTGYVDHEWYMMVRWDLTNPSLWQIQIITNVNKQ